MNTETQKIASAGDFLKKSGRTTHTLPDSQLNVVLRDARPNAAFLAANHYLSTHEVESADETNTQDDLLFLCAYTAAMFVEPTVFNDSSEAAKHWELREAVPLSVLSDGDFRYVQLLAFPEMAVTTDDDDDTEVVTDEDSFRADSANDTPSGNSDDGNTLADEPAGLDESA